MKGVAAQGINATPYVEITWEDGSRKKALFDTGAQWTLMKEDLLSADEKEAMESSSLAGQGVTGDRIPVVGEIWRNVRIGDLLFMKQRFIVVKDMICPIILGIDFWSRVESMTFDFNDSTVRLNDSNKIQLHHHPGDEPSTIGATHEAEPWTVEVAEQITIPGGSEIYVKCRVTRDLEKGRTYLVQPVKEDDNLVSTPFGIIEGTEKQFSLRVANLNRSGQILSAGRPIATLEEDVWIHKTKLDGVFAVKENTSTEIEWDTLCDPELESSKRTQLMDALKKYKQVFYTGGLLPIVTVGVEHKINLEENVTPSVFRPRRLSKELTLEVKDHIEKLLKEGVIRESNSEWASPIVCARKADGSLRLVIDYRVTNTKSKTATLHPIPLIDDLVDHLHDAKYFSILDARSGYHQMPLKEEESCATAFVVPWGHYEFADRTPFGLKGAGYSFQRMMSAILGKSNFIEALCYLDDVLVWGETWDIHMQRLRRVLEKIAKAGLALSPKKCKFGSRYVNYLGCRIGDGAVSICEQRVEQLRRIKEPENVRGLRSAIGAFAYVQRWIPGLAEMAKPLYDATRGKPYSRLIWTEEMKEGFREIKKRIADATALAIPNMEEEFVLVTDCSNIAAGAMLAQEGPTSTLIPCAFFHHTLSQSEKGFSATEKELLAIVLAVKKYRVYLGNKFKLITDHFALQWLKSLNPENETGRRGRWLDLLQQFDMKIVPKRGKSADMRIADFLSRVELDGSCSQERRAHIQTIEQTREDKEMLMGYEELLEKQNADHGIKEIKDVLKKGEDLNFGGSESSDWRKTSITGIPGYKSFEKVKDRLLVDERGLLRLRFNGGKRTKENPFGIKERRRVVVPESARESVLQLTHSSDAASHMGTTRTWQRVRNWFWWPEMKKDIEDYIRGCEQCSKNKHVNNPNKAPSKETSIPEEPLEEIMVDFVGPFQPANSHKFRYALQIQDVFSRYLLLIPTVDSTADTAIETITIRWLACFGLPKKVRSDRGSHFTAEVFKGLCTNAGIKHKFGSPEHPQSQGQVERQNQLVNQVRCVCDNDIEGWPDAIYRVQCSHNSSNNSTTGFTPARILFGKNFNLPEGLLFHEKDDKPGRISIADRTKTRENEDVEIRKIVRENILKDQQRRIEGSSSNGEAYRVGDKVRYKLNDDVRSRLGGKIAPRYSEIHEITEVMGDGFTYRMKHTGRGRPKIRRFDLLKTVERNEEESGNLSNDEVREEASDSNSSNEEPAPSPMDEAVIPEVTPEAVNQEGSRRSTRSRKKTTHLQVNSSKKSYQHSEANQSDSE